MKKLMFAAVAALAFTAFAEEATSEAEDTCNIPVWGFANYGLSSGYKLYGSLVNSEPTLQGYAEINCNLPLGYAGVGVWSNSDLTDKRRSSLRRAFNEFDFNVHWGNDFWFNDDKTYGIFYLTDVVWYYYPQTGRQGRPNTTQDWNHYFEFKNPFVNPFVKWVHEYHNGGDLIDFGAKKTIAVCDKLSITPQADFFWRSSSYRWCFPGFGYTTAGHRAGRGLASMDLGVTANYQLTDHFGLFAKVSYCQILDQGLRETAERATGSTYGKYEQFAWGQVGVSCNF